MSGDIVQRQMPGEILPDEADGFADTGQSIGFRRRVVLGEMPAKLDEQTECQPLKFGSAAS